jgi:tRNA modification GTPase
MFQDTICAPATPQGTGALGIIRVSGKKAVDIVKKIFKGKDLAKAQSHTLHYGYIIDNKEIIDEVLISVFLAPKTFTTENLIEISCHNSPYIIQKIIDLLLKNGAKLANAGEFTQRAFLNGRIDLSQAEAIADLIASENKAGHDVALKQMRGGITSELQKLREELINFAALIELELDFSEEDLEFANRKELNQLLSALHFQLSTLIKTFEYGNALKNGVPVAIIGKPNAGKSSLLNALLKENRAIVSDIPGTTRDTIEESITLNGLKFRFIDTAGLRQTSDRIENMGVERTKEKISEAKIVIHLYEKDLDVLEGIQPLLEGKIIFNLLSKNDINQQVINSNIENSNNFPISVKTGENLEKLKTELVKSLKENIDENALIITNLRHKIELENALKALTETENGLQQGLSGDLLAFHLRDALKHLGNITGEIEIDKDILGTIFGKFCIGK